MRKQHIYLDSAKLAEVQGIGVFNGVKMFIEAQ